MQARKAEIKYDESMAYNKNLSPEARLHYLENERADKDGASMYGKGPNGTAATILGIATAAVPLVKPTYKLGKRVYSGIESLGAGERFSKGFDKKGKESLKELGKEVSNFAKTDVGKELKEKGTTALDKLIKETGKTLKGANMTGKEKGPDLLGMGKKETKGALAGAGLGMLAAGPLGALAGGLAGKAFGKGRDRKNAEGANMMGNSISKHMGGRGCNMYGDGPDMLMPMSVLGRKGRKEARENIKDVLLAPTRIASNVATKIAGEAPKTLKEARQERRLNKIEGASMYGKNPMTKGNGKKSKKSGTALDGSASPRDAKHLRNVENFKGDLNNPEFLKRQKQINKNHNVGGKYHNPSEYSRKYKK